MQTGDEEKQLVALSLYNALKNEDELVKLSGSYSRFTERVKEKYCEVTGYGKFTNNNVVDCWLDSCYASDSYAINAVLFIMDGPTIIYAYNKITEANKLGDFFNHNRTLHIPL